MSASPLVSSRLNPFVSEINFKRSCEAALTRRKRFETDTINNILYNDDPEKPYIEFNGQKYFWYFAIGSMINPISLYLRDLTPIISYPAKCPDYRLVFREKVGMADVEYCPGEEFHGVVHLLPLKQMLYLDQIEHIYKRITVNVINYQHSSRLVHVYKMTLVGGQERRMGIPSERYIDIIIKGCEHFEVYSSYIHYLKYEQPVVPRKSPSQYEKIPNVPKDVFYTAEDLLKHDGKDPTFPLWISVNGKILEYTGLPSEDNPDYHNKKQFYEFASSYLGGREISYAIARGWYEPMFKLPLHEDDLSDDHRAFAEDMCVTFCLNNSDNNYESVWKPIGMLQPTSKVDISS